MNKYEQATTEDKETLEATGPTSLIAAAKLHEAKVRSEAQALPIELGIDPLYTPLIQAAEELRQKVEAKNKEKIEAVKKETAEQTQNLYHKLTDAREEYKRLELQYQAKQEKVNQLSHENEKLNNELNEASEQAAKQMHLIEEHEQTINGLEQRKNTELQAIQEQNTALIDKLKDKIEQITHDYNKQLEHIQQKLNYEQQRLSSEVTTLTETNESLSQELNHLRQEQHLWEQGTSSFEEKIKQLESEKNNMQVGLKEKAEKLLRTEHSLKLSNEELERNQDYIKELEDKNNTLQKELFENWIHKKDEI